MQRHARCDGLAELLSEMLPIARDLHVGLVRNAVAIAHDHGRPGHAFAVARAPLTGRRGTGSATE